MSAVPVLCPRERIHIICPKSSARFIFPSRLRGHEDRDLLPGHE